MVPVEGAAMQVADRHYDAGMIIEMRIVSRNGRVLASVSSSSAQSAQVSGAAGADVRKAVLNQTLARLINTINGDLESKMARNFSPYIDHAKAG
jgi:hypothetical protein